MCKEWQRKLLVFDVEGTLFETTIRLPSTTLDSTIWQAIAQHLGPDAIASEIETHHRWARKEYSSYLDWMKDTIQIHKRFGLSQDLFHKIIFSAKYNPGVVEVLSGIDRNKYEIILISGGFRELAARVQRDFQIHHAFTACEYFFGVDGLLSGYNLLPCDFEGKLDFIKLMLREYRLDNRDWVFIGDGANDVEIALSAPVSVAYRANEKLRKAATICINDFSEIRGVL